MTEIIWSILFSEKNGKREAYDCKKEDSENYSSSRRDHSCFGSGISSHGELFGQEMCIRDRTMESMIHVGDKIVIEKEVPLLTLETVEAVSYTHLDVYKRQDL